MDLEKKLKQILAPEQVSTNATVLLNHSQDESFHPPTLPEVVLFPRNKKDVAKIMEFANEHKVPVVGFGVGSGIEGQVIPKEGGISVDFQEMNQILEINPESFLVRVQPGVTRLELNQALGKYGLFFPVDPGADATIGGMTSTNASGTNTVRYGTMKDNVRDIEVVLADGRIIHTGGKARKSSSGYNLTEMFVGSEGTLGLFAEITLQVYGISEMIVAGRAVFPNVKQAVEAATRILLGGVQIARIELVDAESMKSINTWGGTDYTEKVTLFLEFHGTKGSVDYEVALTKEVFKGLGCIGFDIEKDTRGRAKLWESRHNVFYAFLHQNPGKKILNTDVCVPLGALSSAIEFSRECIETAGLQGGIIGHIGDGNFHAGLTFNPNIEQELELCYEVNDKIVEYALAQGGTCTGEHGVGLGKRKYQRLEHGEALNIMKSIKELLDPNGILNPGKIF